MLKACRSLWVNLSLTKHCCLLSTKASYSLLQVGELFSRFMLGTNFWVVSVGQFITDKTNYLTCESYCWLLSTMASFYRLSNISFQYNISLYQMCAGNFTLNHKTAVANEGRSKMCNRISRATYYATDVRYIWRSIATDNIFHWSFCYCFAL